MPGTQDAAPTKRAVFVLKRSGVTESRDVQ